MQESWRDDVFGQGGRMAFYQFLAIFPSLFLSFAVGLHIPHVRDHLAEVFRHLVGLMFPADVSRLFESILGELTQRARSGTDVLSLLAGTIWATHNGTWAMIYGLNRAYEVQEQRSWWKLTIVISALTLCLVLTAALAISVLIFGLDLQSYANKSVWIVRTLEGSILILATSFALAMLYRFGPNLRDHQWRWSTPGTLCALLLWVLSSLLARLYFDHFNNYTRSYGHLNGVVILLLWLYLTNGAVLIGGEMNSEIQKAEAERDNSDSSQRYSQARSGK